ncbi:MAG: hypothetical protein DMG21_06555 [Acidobacteria bacterium]|nr:MAG: hypothetical protein DMG21_06555 [Acidobacteriota bacterium]
MKRSATSWKSPILIAAIVAGSSLVAFAGTPLICQAIAIGDAKSLPWTSSTAFLNGKENYDITHLANDTLALLTPTMPVIVRMETLRRATVYAQKDPQVAKELLLKLRARALEGGAQASPDALALFDLGYFVECTKQANVTFRKVEGGAYEPVVQPNVASGMDGLAWVEKAIAMRGNDPEMELAAALITVWPRQKSFDDHLRRAASGAREGTLLAQNLVERFGDRGRTIAELRANLAPSR